LQVPKQSIFIKISWHEPFNVTNCMSTFSDTPCRIFLLFYIISTQRTYIYIKNWILIAVLQLKLRAISSLFSFFYTPCVVHGTEFVVPNSLPTCQVKRFSLAGWLNIISCN
jgi:hypothetical protein